MISRARPFAAKALPRLLAVVAVLGAWQVLALIPVHVLPNYPLPGPADVAGKLGELWRQGTLGPILANSLRRGAVGYALAIAIGTVLGAAVARLPLLRSAIGSLLAGLQSLPSVTWVPFGLLIFGTDNDFAIYFVVVLGAFPSIAMGVISAIDQIPPLTLRLARSMNAGGLQLYRHFIVSAALPGYIAGMKQGWAFSWRSLMAAELLSPGIGSGLGALLDQGRLELDVTLMLAALVAILLVGLTIDDIIFAPLERGILRRRGLSAG
jgi:NitT/TauT family transport system permease protein